MKKSALNKRVIAVAGDAKFEECEDSDNPREAAIALLINLEFGGTTSEENLRRRACVPYKKGSSSPECPISGVADDMGDDDDADSGIDNEYMMCAFCADSP